MTGTTTRSGRSSGSTELPAHIESYLPLEHKPVPLDQWHGCLEVHLGTILGREVGKRIRGVLATGFGQSAEQNLDAARNDYLEHAEFLIAGIPEGVPASARLDYQIARRCRDLDSLLDYSEYASQHKRVFVFAAVTVNRGSQQFWAQYVFDQRNASGGIRTLKEVPVQQPRLTSDVAFTRPHNARTRRCLHAAMIKAEHLRGYPLHPRRHHSFDLVFGWRNLPGDREPLQLWSEFGLHELGPQGCLQLIRRSFFEPATPLGNRDWENHRRGLHSLCRRPPR